MLVNHMISVIPDYTDCLCDTTELQSKVAHLAEVLPHDLDEVGHGEVHDVVPPGCFQHHVGPQEVVACEEASGKALLLLLLQEPLQQLLS